MAGKKISKDMDFAAGFFSSSVSNNISLDDISIPDGIIDMYQNRQSKKK